MAFEHLPHERYVYAYSGEINREDIDPASGRHDELLDWGYPADSELLIEVEGLVKDAFRAMLDHTSKYLDEPVDSEYKHVTPNQMVVLGNLATSLGTDYTML